MQQKKEQLCIFTSQFTHIAAKQSPNIPKILASPHQRQNILSFSLKSGIRPSHCTSPVVISNWEGQINASGHNIGIVHVPKSIIGNTANSMPNDQKSRHKQIRDLTLANITEMHHSGLVPLVVHQLWSVKKHSAENTVSSFGSQLIQCEPVICSALANITEQRQLTSLVPTELSNCCEAGSKRVKINPLSVFPSCSKHSQWKVANI